MAERKIEHDFPPGHPARGDWNPDSPEAREWARVNVLPQGERDFPVDHPGALDTPGNMNQMEVRAGIDPRNPHREAFTGRTPEQAAAVADLSRLATLRAHESPVMEPIDAEVVNEMLEEKRKELGRDRLSAEEYADVLASYHRLRQ